MAGPQDSDAGAIRQVDLDSEGEEPMLATLDPIGAMAGRQGQLDALLRECKTASGRAAMLAEIAKDAGLYQGGRSTRGSGGPREELRVK